MRKLFAVVLGLSTIMIAGSVVYANFFTGVVDSARSGNATRLEKQISDSSTKDSLLIKRLINYAIVNDRPDCVRLLTKYIKNPDYTINDSQTPLELASACGTNEIVKVLIQSGADVNYSVPTKDGAVDTPLREAMANLKYDTAKLLLERGADPETCCPAIISPIQENLKEKSRDLIKLCIEKGADLKGDFGTSALEFAVYIKDRAFAANLMEKGARFSDSSLMMAVENKDMKLIDEHFKRGLEIDSESAYRALNEALLMKDDKIFEYFLAKGVPIEEGKTLEHLKWGLPLSSDWGDALSTAVMQDDYKAAQLLIQKGADVNGKSVIARYRPLFIAVNNCNPRMVKLLLENGASVNLEGLTEGYLAGRITDIKKTQVDWFDYRHKKDCNEILSLLNKYQT